MKRDFKNTILIEKLNSSIKSEYGLINRYIDELLKSFDGNHNEIIKDEYALLEAYKVEASSKFDVESVFKEITLINSLKSHLEMLNESVNRFSPHNITANMNNLINKILNGISIVSNKLWQLLSQIANLKEWSLEGDVSTNAHFGIFSLKGGVKLRLSFN